MLKSLATAASVAAALAIAPAIAQQDQPPTTEGAIAMVGLPIYSSDGEKLGQVTKVGTSGGQPAVQAEIGGFLGVEQSTVVISAAAFQQKPDRLELTMTAAEVGQTLSKQRQPQPE
ncbi:MAG: PRC-barrel domain-containing protein [Bacteroidota bacterium]|jgi:hypothetical protein